MLGFKTSCETPNQILEYIHSTYLPITSCKRLPRRLFVIDET